jgi:hypothetical protein
MDGQVLRILWQINIHINAQKLGCPAEKMIIQYVSLFIFMDVPSGPFSLVAVSRLVVRMLGLPLIAQECKCKLLHHG